jgi:polar amino acid transport system permease protein
MSGASATGSRDCSRVRPRVSTVGQTLRTSAAFLQAALVLALVAWLVWRGAEAMQYRWQWERVPRYLVRVVDGGWVWGPLMRGLGTTVQICALAGLLTLVIGIGTAAMRLSRSFAARTLARGYLELIRNTPLLVQLFLFYFVIAPIVGVDRFWAGVLCISFFEGSFASEIIRGGLLAVPRGQYEAAAAIGLGGLDRYRDVIIPQAVGLILPPLTGVLISLIKHSAILTVIAVTELTTAGQNIIADTFMAFEIWFTVAGIYLALTVSLSFAAGFVEARFNRGR